MLSDVSFENPHLEGSLEGSLEWREGRSDPLLGVSARIGRADLAWLPLYLPNEGLGPELKNWLLRAVDGGHLEGGELRIEGALSDWPFDNGEGSVNARARVSGMDLHYSPHWPSIEALTADLHFEGRRAEFSLSQGGIRGAELIGAHVRIPRMGREAVLDIEGEVSGSTGQAADFLRNSPLAPRFRAMLDALEATGPAELALRIAVPLPAGTKKVSGHLEVRDNRTRLPGLAEGTRGGERGLPLPGRGPPGRRGRSPLSRPSRHGASRAVGVRESGPHRGGGHHDPRASLPPPAQRRTDRVPRGGTSLLALAAFRRDRLAKRPSICRGTPASTGRLLLCGSARISKGRISTFPLLSRRRLPTLSTWRWTSSSAGEARGWCTRATASSCPRFSGCVMPARRVRVWNGARFAWAGTPPSCPTKRAWC